MFVFNLCGDVAFRFRTFVIRRACLCFAVGVGTWGLECGCWLFVFVFVFGLGVVCLFGWCWCLGVCVMFVLFGVVCFVGCA